MPGRVGLAVSGGGDSVALMHLAAGRLRARLHVATVDHGLREDSAAEAEAVGLAAGALGLPHETLAWAGPGPVRSGLQKAAREARIALLARWAERHGLDAVLTGHTMDDQAETVLMRLARGGGPRAISAIPLRRGPFARPLLGARRADLRDWLEVGGIAWAEDPSNEDGRFERVRWRRAMPQLEALGLTVPALARTAARMAEAAGARAPRPELDGTARLCAAPAMEDLRAAIRMVGTAEPRPSDLERALARGDARFTAGGCIVTRAGDGTVVAPEPARLGGVESPLDDRGRGTWRLFDIDAPEAPGATVAMLGEEGARIVRRTIPVPHLTYLTLPALWRDGALLAFHPELHDRATDAPRRAVGPAYSLCIGGVRRRPVA